MFSIEMLPAAHGDCLWVEYGLPQKPRRILIDGGVAATESILQERFAKSQENFVFELLIVSHVDGDHIEGVVKFLANLPRNVKFKEIWFNAWKHLPPPPHQRLGPGQGEMLTTLIEKLKIPWNKRFRQKAVALKPSASSLPTCSLAGGLKLTLLSPTLDQLTKLRPKWRQACLEAGIVPGAGAPPSSKLRPRRLGARNQVEDFATAPYSADTAVANGSSIAVLAQFGKQTALLCADAFPEVLETSIDVLLGKSGARRLKVHAWKVSHHGSQCNTSPSLARKVDCGCCLISSNGSIFEHPDPESIARILYSRPMPRRLCFNYKSQWTALWDNRQWMKAYNYRAEYPVPTSKGFKVNLV